MMRQETDDGRERRVIEIVEALLAELGAGARRPVAPQASLDRDLGIGSLERVELLLRLEQEFGIRLPDAVMAEAGSPRDLARAIRDAGPLPRAESAAPARSPVVGPAV